MNFSVQIITESASKQHICDRLDYILDLMDKEHHVAATHSQRNAFQAVIRILLEQLREEVRYARPPDRQIEPSDESVPL